MKKFMKKLTGILLAVSMLITMLPVSVSAYYGEDAMNEAKIDLDKVFIYDSDNELVTEVTDDDVVYFSISNDGEYVQSDITDDTMAYIPVKISDVAKVDLADYGLGAFKWESYDLLLKGESDQYYVTLMQLFVYVTENYYSEGWEPVQVTGSSGSTYLKSGFWGHDENLTYYVNGEYPLQRPGFGATSDHIALEAGDYVDVQMYTDWSFWSTDGAGYRYFVDQTSGEIVHKITTDLCAPATIKLGRAWGDVDKGADTSIENEEEGYGVYVTKEKDPSSHAVWSEVVDGEGNFKITELAPGTYYLWAHGNTISAPAYAELEVTCSHTDTEAKNVRSAACAKEGYTGDIYCKGCKAELKEGAIVPVTGDHTPGEGIVTPATTGKAGSIKYTCSVCGTLTGTETIACPEKISLSAASYTYDGRTKNPGLKVYDSNHKQISAAYYTVSCPSGRKNVGTYTYTIKFKGNYSGTQTVSFTILPKKAVIKKVSAGKKSLTVYAKSGASALGGAGYQIAYKIAGTSVWKYKNTTAIKKKITGLKKGKRYQVRVRAYKKGKGTTYYGPWSASKKSTAVK